MMGMYNICPCVILEQSVMYNICGSAAVSVPTNQPTAISGDFTELVSTLASQYFFEDISIPLLAYSERYLNLKNT